MGGHYTKANAKTTNTSCFDHLCTEGHRSNHSCKQPRFQAPANCHQAFDQKTVFERGPGSTGQALGCDLTKHPYQAPATVSNEWFPTHSRYRSTKTGSKTLTARYYNGIDWSAAVHSAVFQSIANGLELPSYVPIYTIVPIKYNRMNRK